MACRDADIHMVQTSLLLKKAIDSRKLGNSYQYPVAATVKHHVIVRAQVSSGQIFWLWI